MGKQHNDESTWDVTGRIKALEQFSGSFVARPRTEGEAIPITAAPPTRAPEPRRSRIFLRGGSGHGVFADLTVTAPLPRPALD